MSSRSKRAKKPPVREARYKHREPQTWRAFREELLHHVDAGDDYVRPDRAGWRCNDRVVIVREIPADAPDAVLAELFEEAVAATPNARPTEIVVADAAMRDALATRFKGDLPIHVMRGGFVDDERLTTDDDDRLEAEEWTLLEGAKVTAAAVGAVVEAWWALHGKIRWTSMIPWDVELSLRAPSLGLEDASVRVHAFDERVSFARTVADRDGTFEWRRGARPQGTRFLDLACDQERVSPALADEATAHGWRSPAHPDLVAVVSAFDVDDVPRKLVASDLTLAHTILRALDVWFAEDRVDPWNSTPIVVDAGDGVTLTLKGFLLATTDAETPDAWADEALPEAHVFADSYAPHDALLAALRDAGETPPADLAARVKAAGADAVPALVAALRHPESWGMIDDRVNFFGLWVLVALGHLGDARAWPDVLRFAVTRDAELGEVVTEELPSVFAGFGPAAIPGLTRVLTSVVCDSFVRIAAAKALYLVGVDHPAVRPTVRMVYRALVAAIDEDFDPDGVIGPNALDEAAAMHDDAIDALVASAFDAGRLEEGVYGRGSYEEARRAPTWTRAERVDHRTTESLLRAPLWRVI